MDSLKHFFDDRTERLEHFRSLKDKYISEKV